MEHRAGVSQALCLPSGLPGAVPVALPSPPTPLHCPDVPGHGAATLSLQQRGCSALREGGSSGRSCPTSCEEAKAANKGCNGELRGEPHL